MSTGWHTVHVRVNDAATGQPTPARIRFTGPEGEYLAPFGRFPEFATGRNQDVGGNVLVGAKPHAYIDGSCEIHLPAGLLRVEIHKGPEYKVLAQEFPLAAGKISLRFALERWTDLRRQGWYSGDVRAHFLSPHAALLEAAAEDLAVVNLLAGECEVLGPYRRKYPAIPNLLAFSGQRPALEMPGHLVAVNTLNSHPVLGSLGLLNCHRVVYPLSFGGPSGWDDWALADWCDQCHRKGGLVVWAQTAHETADFAYGEPLADLILGKIDAFEITFFEDSVFDVLADWYALLNCGFRVPLAGGSGKDGNGLLLGAMRTYAHMKEGEAFAYAGWIEAVRSGRTFVTNGPLLSFTVAGQGPGSVLDLAAPGQVLRVRAEAHSQVPFERLELLANGKVVAETGATGSPRSAILEYEWPAGESNWLAARATGTKQIPHRPASQRVFAHTSPVYVQVAGQKPRSDSATVVRLAGHLDKMLEWVHSKGRFEKEHARAHLADIFQSARTELLKRVGG